MLQRQVHPDFDGDHDLSALVNSAFSEISTHPDRIEVWIEGMSNGTGEYLSVIENLVERVERTEREDEELRAKYAELIVSQSDFATSGRVRSARAPSVSPPPTSGVGTARATVTSPPPTHTKSDDISKELIADGLFLVKSNTYALGVDVIRTGTDSALVHPKIVISGKEFYRPMTFEEVIRLRVEAYESGIRDGLFNIVLDSCNGIVYKKGTTKFKVVPLCKELILIDRDYKRIRLFVNYKVIAGVKLDSSRGKFGVDSSCPLTKSEIIEHPGWLASVNGDTVLLKTYRDIVFAEYERRFGKAKKLVGYWIKRNTKDDELRAVFVDNLSNGSDVNGWYYVVLAVSR